jgi:hypothetical protein
VGFEKTGLGIFKRAHHTEPILARSAKRSAAFEDHRADVSSRVLCSYSVGCLGRL